MGLEIKCGIPASERLESATLTEDYGPRSRRIGVYTKKARPNRQGILFLSLSLFLWLTFSWAMTRPAWLAPRATADDSSLSRADCPGGSESPKFHHPNQGLSYER